MRVKNKHVSDLAGLLATEWVRRSLYELSKAEIVSAFSALLDVADCLVEARNRRLGCEATATFDSKALKLAGFASVWLAGGTPMLVWTPAEAARTQPRGLDLARSSGSWYGPNANWRAP